VKLEDINNDDHSVIKLAPSVTSDDVLMISSSRILIPDDHKTSNQSDKMEGKIINDEKQTKKETKVEEKKDLMKKFEK